MSSTENNVRPSLGQSVSYVDQPESLLLPYGPVSEETTELLHEFVHPHHAPEETLVGSDEDDDDDDDDDEVKPKRPWWKRPSPWWLIAAMPFSAIAMSATLAPRIEIYTMLVCSVYKPDIFKHSYPGGPEIRFNEISAPKLDVMGSPSPVIPDAPHHPAIPIFISGPSKDNDTSSPGNQCASDPVVQAEVARLSATITTTMGILSLLTTGWWGAFSDRHGRTRVMGLSVIGLVIADFNFIAVTAFWKHLPGGYWLLLIGPIVEGFFGGLTTGVAAIHAYMADTTNEGMRSRIFSTSLGLMFTGMAFGPTLGSLLIHFTDRTMSVFYVAAAVHVLYTIYVWTILPESLSKKRMAQSRVKYANEMADAISEREHNPAVGLLVKSRRLFAFLTPLAVFLPAEEKRSNSNPLKSPKKDWNLTVIALGYACTITLMGSYGVKFQYAASAFHWNSEIIGYWLSLIGATRAFFLTLVLPLAIKLFKPKPVTIEIPVPTTERTPLIIPVDDDNATPTPSSSSAMGEPRTTTKEIHSPYFDLNLARVSLFIDILSYAGMGLVAHAGLFTWFGVLGSFGAGFSPAVQSVALALYARRGGTEVGRLFGALSVLQALCSQIVGPTLYGFVYIRTVAKYPAAIFAVSTASVAISFVLLGFVRVPSRTKLHRESLVDLEEPGVGAASGGASEAEGSPAHAHAQEGTLVDTASEITVKPTPP